MGVLSGYESSFQGKVKTVDEQMEHCSDMKREPQLGFDTFTSQLGAKQAESLFLSRMYYIYHFQSEMDVTPERVPPQICPVAFINFRHSALAAHPPIRSVSTCMLAFSTFTFG